MLQYLHHFTDDTTLFLNNPNIPNLETNLNVELENVNQWSYANKLSKSCFVVFHSRQRRTTQKLKLIVSPRFLLSLIIKLNI